MCKSIELIKTINLINQHCNNLIYEKIQSHSYKDIEKMVNIWRKTGGKRCAPTFHEMAKCHECFLRNPDSTRNFECYNIIKLAGVPFEVFEAILKYKLILDGKYI